MTELSESKLELVKDDFEAERRGDSSRNGRRQMTFDLLDQFTDGKRFALDFVVADAVDQELASQQHSQLSHVQLGHKDAVKRLEQRAKIAGERIEIAKVCVADAMPCLLGSLRTAV